MAKALYRKWRPKDWDEVTAQEHVIQTLRNAVVHDRVAHAYLFAGPRGTGKTTTARLLAKSVNCLEPDLKKRPCNKCEHCLALNAGRFMDLIEIDAASNTSVDDVRDLREKINFSPSQGKFKVYIIDEVHMLSTAAFNALLKTLEEPPPHAIFVLATTEIHKIPATVLSRCQQHEFRRIPVNDIVRHLKTKSQEENIHVEDAVLTIIARQATGSLRDAISLLDQLTTTDEPITVAMAQNVLGTATNLSVVEIVDALIERNSALGLTLINKALDSGTDPRQLARQLVSYLRNILLFKMGNQDQVEEAENIREKIHEHANNLAIGQLLKAIEAFNQATSDERANWQPGLGLELAFTAFMEDESQNNKAVPSPLKKDHQKSSTSVASEQTKKTKPAKPIKQAKKIKPPDEKKESPVQKPEVSASQTEEKIQPQEESEAPIPQEKPASVETSEGVTLSDLHTEWERIKALVGNHNRRTEGLLNSSKLAGLKQDTLILGFSSEILKDMMEKEGNLNLTKDILEEVFDQPINIQCIVTSSQAGSIPDNLKIEKNGMVSTATRDLGGRISSAKEEN